MKNTKTFKISLITVAMLSDLLIAASAYSDSSNACTVANGCAQLTDHDGYWVTKIKPEGSPFKVTVINDMRVNTETNRVTVYAQSRILGKKVVAPAQLSPGECEKRRSGTVCSHPDAVYLNRSGKELNKDDGSGAWWVKHSWVLGGEGYDNSELKPMESYPSMYVEGELLDDGITMKIGNPTWGHNLRWPVYSNDGDNVGYVVQRFSAVKQTDGSYTYEPGFKLTWACKNKISEFDGKKRGCPKKGK